MAAAPPQGGNPNALSWNVLRIEFNTYSPHFLSSHLIVSEKSPTLMSLPPTATDYGGSNLYSHFTMECLQNNWIVLLLKQFITTNGENN